jgi:hypothetical protein
MPRGFHIWTLLILGGWLFMIGPGQIDGWLRPVVTKTIMEARVDPKNSEWVYVSGSFTKLRDNCGPRRIEWYLGQRDDPNTPVEYTWGKPRVRNAGVNYFYDWHVRAAPPAVLANETFADVLHQCVLTIPVINLKLRYPWLTRTKFWN